MLIVNKREEGESTDCQYKCGKQDQAEECGEGKTFKVQWGKWEANWTTIWIDTFLQNSNE